MNNFLFITVDRHSKFLSMVNKLRRSQTSAENLGRRICGLFKRRPVEGVSKRRNSRKWDASFAAVARVIEFAKRCFQTITAVNKIDR